MTKWQQGAVWKPLTGDFPACVKVLIWNWPWCLLPNWSFLWLGNKDKCPEILLMVIFSQRASSFRLVVVLSLEQEYTTGSHMLYLCLKTSVCFDSLCSSITDSRLDFENYFSQTNKQVNFPQETLLSLQKKIIHKWFCVSSVLGTQYPLKS